ncbi:MAG: biotin/lipoyl-binding protein [Chitinispirillales bacterium]|jgi:biotin carboxyl carrier protein|nr:biotin/lipoyl-binding protein [Chitinispirillales bacterium]
MDNIKNRNKANYEIPDARINAQADEMVKLTGINAWVVLTTIFALIAGAVTWAFFGTILLREDNPGVIVKAGKIINTYATDDYRLLDLNIKPGEYVETGQVIARAERQELVNEINKLISQKAASNQISLKRAELIEESQIITPESGRVVDVFVHANDYLKKGTKIATISKEALEGSAMECYLFVPSSRIKNIRKNMSVNIYPANVSREIYGNMTGTVTLISEFPVTENYLFGMLGSRELALEFLKNDACYEVYINLEPSEETVTGYAWTTSFGPPKKFGNITLCDASVIVENLRPADLILKR